MVSSSLIFYIFSASCILVYGIGLKDLLLAVDNPKNVFFYFLKTLFSSISAIVLTWIITTYVLAPKNLTDMFPFFLIFISLAFSILFSFLCKLIFKREINEFLLSFFITFLAVNEGTTLPQAILIGSIVSGAFYLLIPFLYSIKYRINISLVNIDLKKGAIILLSIGILLILLFAYNISWFNFEVV